MAVIVFMYHRTPARSADSQWDVPMPVFRTQIECLRERGCSFIRFSDALEDRFYREGTHVSLTFDDGHESNADAFEFLRGLGIVPTAFIVSEWIAGKEGFLSASAIAGLGGSCDFGGHGATHASLTSLPQPQLVDELRGSRAALEDLLQREVRSMSLPGGAFDDRVIAAARDCGFRAIGNSVDLINSTPGVTLNRVAVRQEHGATHLADLAAAGRVYWLRRRARLSGTRALAARIGPVRYEKLMRAMGRRSS